MYIYINIIRFSMEKEYQQDAHKIIRFVCDIMT